MGTWGVQIFSNDDACDIRDIYLKNLLAFNDNEAEIVTVQECKDYNPNILWVALALTEWKYGRLSVDVKQKALKAIDEERSSLDTLWPIKMLEKRRKVLSKVYEQLSGQMPKRKKVSPPGWSWKCPWSVGEVLQYKICCPGEPFKHLIGQYVLLPIILISKSSPQDIPCDSLVVGLCDWMGKSTPDKTFIGDLGLIPFTFLGGHTKKYMTVSFDPYTMKESDIKCVGNFPVSKLKQYYGESIAILPPTNGLFTQSLSLTFSDKQ